MTNDVRQNAPAEVQGAVSSDKEGAVPAPGGTGASCHQGSGLTGFLKMAACCAAPILLLAALPYFGGALGVTGASLLSTLALLACPLGMGWMMWRMSRQQAAVVGRVNPPVPVAGNVLEEPRQARPPVPLAEPVPLVARVSEGPTEEARS